MVVRTRMKLGAVVQAAEARSAGLPGLELLALGLQLRKSLLLRLLGRIRRIRRGQALKSLQHVPNTAPTGRIVRVGARARGNGEIRPPRPTPRPIGIHNTRRGHIAGREVLVSKHAPTYFTWQRNSTCYCQGQAVPDYFLYARW